MRRRTFERATLLLDPPFRQAVGPGELDIPAVRGVGGSLVYFLDLTSALGRVWDIEFDDTGETGNDAGLTTVDHISSSTQYEEMLTWLLFYTSLLDLRKMPPQEVADPGGLVRSQVVESPDGALSHRAQRLAEPAHAIVALPDRAVRLGRAAHCPRHRRPCRDREAPREERRAPARHSGKTITTTFWPRQICRPISSTLLKAHNILYDREGNAEYLQVYTESYDQRFFFEIVQRRGYRGYGACQRPGQAGRAGPPVGGRRRTCAS